MDDFVTVVGYEGGDEWGIVFPVVGIGDGKGTALYVERFFTVVAAIGVPIGGQWSLWSAVHGLRDGLDNSFLLAGGPYELKEKGSPGMLADVRKYLLYAYFAPVLGGFSYHAANNGS